MSLSLIIDLTFFTFDVIYPYILARN